MVASRPMAELLELSRAGSYRIRVRGPLTAPYRGHLEGWDVAEADGDTILLGTVTDDVQLYCVLDDLRRRHAPLLEVTPADPDLEDVYCRLMGNEAVAVMR